MTASEPRLLTCVDIGCTKSAGRGGVGSDPQIATEPSAHHRRGRAYSPLLTPGKAPDQVATRPATHTPALTPQDRTCDRPLTAPTGASHLQGGQAVAGGAPDCAHRGLTPGDRTMIAVIGAGTPPARAPGLHRGRHDPTDGQETATGYRPPSRPGRRATTSKRVHTTSVSSSTSGGSVLRKVNHPR